MISAALVLSSALMAGDATPCLLADVDGDQTVDITDLLAVLAQWGPCPDCPADLDGSGDVGVTDLLIVLEGFGATVDAAWFADEVFPHMGGDPASRIAAIDVTRDGAVDILQLDSDGWLRVHANDGCGRFSHHSAIPIAADFQDVIRLVDVDGDQDLDVLVTYGAGDVVHLLLQTADGLAAPTAIAVGDRPRDLVGGDIDGDGDQDLIVAAFNDNVAIILTNDGSGVFQIVDERNAGGQPHSLAMDDIDNDGDLDFAVGNVLNSLVWFNEGDGVFGGADVYASHNQIGLVDVDLDGFADLVSNKYPDFVVRLNNGDGTFDTSTSIEVDGAYSGFTVADMDPDGHADVVLGQYGDVLLSRPGAPELLRHDLARAGGYPVVADVDGNDRPDLVRVVGPGDLAIVTAEGLDFLSPSPEDRIVAV